MFSFAAVGAGTGFGPTALRPMCWRAWLCDWHGRGDGSAGCPGATAVPITVSAKDSHPSKAFDINSIELDSRTHGTVAVAEAFDTSA